MKKIGKCLVLLGFLSTNLAVASENYYFRSPIFGIGGNNMANNENGYESDPESDDLENCSAPVAYDYLFDDNNYILVDFDVRQYSLFVEGVFIQSGAMDDSFFNGPTDKYKLDMYRKETQNPNQEHFGIVEYKCSDGGTINSTEEANNREMCSAEKTYSDFDNKIERGRVDLNSYQYLRSPYSESGSLPTRDEGYHVLYLLEKDGVEISRSYNESLVEEPELFYRTSENFNNIATLFLTTETGYPELSTGDDITISGEDFIIGNIQGSNDFNDGHFYRLVYNGSSDLDIVGYEVPVSETENYQWCKDNNYPTEDDAWYQ